MTTIGLLRPTLLPGLARIRRGPRTLQFGVDPRHAVVVDLADERVAGVVDLLDGTLTEQQLLSRAVRRGARSGDVRALLTTLHAHGLLVAAHSLACPPDLRAETAALALRCARRRLPGVANRTPDQIMRGRAEARVAVVGRGRLAAPIAVALAGSGVGHVRADLPGEVRPEETVLGLDPAAVGRPRSAAVAAALRRARTSAARSGSATPASRAGSPTSMTARAGSGTAVTAAPPGVRAGKGKPQLIVRVGADQPVNLATTALRRRGQAVLVVDIRDGTPVIGPFVAAGGSPCLACLDRHRIDRDPAWPEIAAGLATAPPAEACDLVTIMAATAFAVAEVLAHLDGGRPRTAGAAVELVSPGELRWRYWPPHPRCSCGSSRHDLGSP
ncbi:hypothetical protein [Asanoa ferruginea]|uniref:hypothetical protein n=1 Tax=Asanoa ferruginea TaxID=53367 RepID=UPI0014776705|nr:hypothetical protein [Asanoa ferruginea]